MAFFEALMVSADENHSQIDLSEADVHVKHILLCAAWNADWSPRLSVSHRAERHHEVEDHSHVYKRSKDDVQLIVSLASLSSDLPSALIESNSSVNTLMTLSYVISMPNL